MKKEMSDKTIISLSTKLYPIPIILRALTYFTPICYFSLFLDENKELLTIHIEPKKDIEMYTKDLETLKKEIMNNIILLMG